MSTPTDRGHALSDAVVAAEADMSEAEKRIHAARERLAAADRKYKDYKVPPVPAPSRWHR